MKQLKNGYKEYLRYYTVPHNSECRQYVRNKFYLHLPLRSHGQEGEHALLLNTLSGELFILNEQEDLWWVATEKGTDLAAIHEAAQLAFVQKLIGHDMLVPPAVNMTDVLDQGRQAANETRNRSFSLSEGYSSYTVFTTTECNARCFYCYEKGTPMKRMTPQMALKVAQYIEKNYQINQRSVNIRWFGGEPLYNIEAIDIISDYLNTHRVPFDSSMISNGYLFTPDVQLRAKEQWHLLRVQITLDGQEDRYNRTKNYIYQKENNPSPYKRVVSHILSADKNDIPVSIRVNVDLHNAGELTELADEIKGLIGNRKSNVTMYSHALFDQSTHVKGENRDAIIAQSQLHLMQHLAKTGLSGSRSARQNFEPRVYWCMSDNPHSITILPDGKFGKCEHWTDSNVFSDIHGSFHDQQMYDKHFEAHPHHESCMDCPLMPQCIRLKLCQSPATCTPPVRKTEVIEKKAQMIAVYKDYRNKNKKLKEAGNSIPNGMKIQNYEALKTATPAHIWAPSHAEYAATLPEGTWAVNFVFSFRMGNHAIQNMALLRLDHGVSSAKVGDSSVLQQSVSAIVKAYFDEHPDDILVIRQKPAGQRLTARWYAAYNALHPDTVAMLQGEAKNKDGELIQLSIFVDRRCKDFDIVCEALSEQYHALV